MLSISEIIGQRIRYYRKQQHISQEKLAELSNLHPTYIGQLERGEKNATLESLYRICVGLEISMSKLLDKIDAFETADSMSIRIYDLVSNESPNNQKIIYQIISQMLTLK